MTLDEIEANHKQITYGLITQSEGPLTNRVSAFNVKSFLVESLCREISIWRDIRSLVSMYIILKSEAPDIVHTHSSKTGILGRLAARLAGVKKIIHTVHGFSFPSTNSLVFKLLFFCLEFAASKITDTLIVMNKKDEQISLKYFKNSRCRISYVANSVDRRIFYPASIHDKSKLKSDFFKNDKFVIGFVGRLDAQKNPVEFLRAAHQVLNVRKDVIFYIIGNGSLHVEIESFINDFGLNSNIRLLGWRSNVYDFLRFTDILVSTSLYEGMPLNLLEAMSSGVAVIASDVTGNQDLIVNESNGFLYELGDHEKLARKICLLIEDDNLRSRFIEKSLNITETLHDPDLRINTINSIYTN